MKEGNPEKSLHAFFEIEPQAQAILAEWGVHINGTEIVNTRPYALFASQGDQSEDAFIKMAGKLKGIKIYSLPDGRVAYEIHTNDEKILKNAYVNTPHGVRLDFGDDIY